MRSWLTFSRPALSASDAVLFIAGLNMSFGRGSETPPAHGLCRISERVNDLHAALFKVANVTRSEGKPVFQRGGSDHPVQQRKRSSVPLQIDDQPRPTPADCGVPGKVGDGPYHRLEPLFESCPLASRRKREYPDAQLAEDDGIHARSGSLALNHSTTFSLGIGLVGSLSTFASTR